MIPFSKLILQIRSKTDGDSGITSAEEDKWRVGAPLYLGTPRTEHPAHETMSRSSWQRDLDRNTSPTEGDDNFCQTTNGERMIYSAVLRCMHPGAHI